MPSALTHKAHIIVNAMLVLPAMDSFVKVRPICCNKLLMLFDKREVNNPFDESANIEDLSRATFGIERPEC